MRVYRMYMGQNWDRLGQNWDRFPNVTQIHYIYYARYVCAYTRKEILSNLLTIIKQGKMRKK